MTIPFRIYKDNEPNVTLEKLFLAEALKFNLKELQGHRSVGGIRAAIFNALSYEEIESLVDFMRKFKELNENENENKPVSVVNFN
jgi:phosphoserine aminotransferase